MNIAKYVSGSLIPEVLKNKVYESSLYIKQKADVENIYHCCTHKSASQWVRSLLSDKKITYRYCGMSPFNHYEEWLDGAKGDPRPMRERYFHDFPFPKNTIATPIYLNYECFASIPKPSSWRAFFVLRDPRDIVVSWYFYHKHGNHVPTDLGDKIEEKLNRIAKIGGLRFSIDYLQRFGLFDMQRSWANAESESNRIKIFRYEDLTGPHQAKYVMDLFDHCRIPIPETEVKDLLAKHAFEKSTGRSQGEEDRSSHYRKGKTGDWKSHFDEETERHFSAVTRKISKDLGYK